MLITDLVDALDGRQRGVSRHVDGGRRGFRKRADASKRTGILFVVEGADADPTETEAVLDELRETLRAAHAFTFADTPLEGRPDGTWSMPTLSPEEAGFWNDGLIPTPFPTCFYEYETPARQKVGILAREGGDASGARWVDLWKVVDMGSHPSSAFHGRATPVLDVDAFAVRLHRMGTIPRRLPAGVDPRTVDALVAEMTASPDEAVEAVLSRARGRVVGVPVDRVGSLAARTAQVRRLLLEQGFDLDAGIGVGMVEAAVRGHDAIFAFLTMMIGSTSTTVEEVEPRPFANRRRAERGLSRDPSHRLVRIVPRRIAEALERDGEGPKGHRRIHWRRSHLRHYASGKVAVIPRHVVGLRTLDEKAPAPNEYLVGRRTGAAADDDD